ncbi:MAG: hypothetical protein IIB57_03020 [Planctomycetes bacterium]|nr:hypothetical protein [Planctomycetota bacterium]
MTDTIAFLDFETTGLYADHGDRPTEVAVVFVRSQTIVDRFQSLMNPGRQIPDFVVHLTGITNSMVKNAPSPTSVMRQLHSKLGNIPIVAHNASFDRKFLENTASRIVEMSPAYPGGMFEADGNYTEFVRRKEAFLEAQITAQLDQKLIQPVLELLRFSQQGGIGGGRFQYGLANVLQAVFRVTRDAQRSSDRTL